MAVQQVQKGATAYLSFSVRDASRILINADALPSVTGIQLSGAATVTTGITIIQQQDATPANITGRYYAKILNTTTTGWADLATGEIQLTATIGGTVCTEELKFIVRAATSSTPYIDVD